MNQVRVQTADAIKQRVDALAQLLDTVMRDQAMTAEQVAAKAKELKLGRSFSVRSVRNYRTGKGTEPPTRHVVTGFAKIFGKMEQVWLRRCGFSGSSPDLLWDRNTIVAAQERLEPGDEVVLISSRPFLEARDFEVAKLVHDNLAKGVVYSYYYPTRTSTFGAAAADSYAVFRQAHEKIRDRLVAPKLFGFSVDPTSFQFFSHLHTIVHFGSVARRGDDQTYCYIEPAIDKDRSGEAWYSLTADTWREVFTGLTAARAPIADGEKPIVPLNPKLPGVRGVYANWFAKEESVKEYAELRSVLGHSGEACLEALKEAISNRIRQKEGSIRYLDVGCGDGTLTKQIADHLVTHGKTETVGIDLSKAQLEAAEKAFGDGSAFVPHHLSFEHFEGAEGFDVITAIHSLYTVDEAYIRRLFKLLAPGGSAYIWMAMRKSNVVCSLCDTLDGELRRGQLRNAAEDIEVFCKAAGLAPHVKPFPHPIDSLLIKNTDKPKESGLPKTIETPKKQEATPTAHGKRLINFCALKELTENSAPWSAAVSVLSNSTAPDFPYKHPLTDSLIVFQRPV